MKMYDFHENVSQDGVVLHSVNARGIFEIPAPYDISCNSSADWWAHNLGGELNERLSEKKARGENSPENSTLGTERS